MTYHAQSKALLTEAHGTASGALEGKMYQREHPTYRNGRMRIAQDKIVGGDA